MKNLNKFISLITAGIIGISALPRVCAENNETVNNVIAASVSGYVSLMPGMSSFTLASADKIPKIYVDGAEENAVKRATADFRSDIEKVTGIRPALNISEAENNNLLMSSDNETEIKSLIQSLDITTGEMTVDTRELFDKRGRGITAVYNREGTLEKVFFSNNIAEKDINKLNFNFNGDDFKDKIIKGFLWEVNKNDTMGCMPLSKSYVYNTDINVPTATPANIPSDEPTAPPDEAWSDADIIIGTIGESEAIDALAASGKMDVSDISGKWESFRIQIVDDKLVIAGSDKRGTVYGMYDVSEKIGVSPWYWWADVPIGHADTLYINLTEPYTEGEPSVKYRGIFINDEYTFASWAKSKGDTDYTDIYEHIFELLLRLKGNYLWPAMHDYSPAFHKNALNAENAAKYGIVMGSSHCEMFLRNNMNEFPAYAEEWKAKEENKDKNLYYHNSEGVGYYVYTDVDASGQKAYNKELLLDYWRDSLEKYGNYDNIYNVGMRGIHDEGLLINHAKINESSQQNLNEAKEVIEEVISEQRKLIKDVLGKEPEDVPQMFIPYKEVMPVYREANLSLPDDVTIMWTNDNYGYIRQLPTEEEAQRSGGAGVYYHFNYNGKPYGTMWLSTRPMTLIREEMVKAYDSSANKVWVVNVGDLKPTENQLEYFMDLADDVEGMRSRDIREWAAEKAKRDFGFNDEDAKEYADIRMGFDKLTSACKPEFLRYNWGNFSNTAYNDEAQIYLDKYNSLIERSTALYNSVDESRKAAFYELQLYPLEASYAYAQKHDGNQRSSDYAKDGRGQSVNKYARLTQEASENFNTSYDKYINLENGKWKGGVKIKNNPAYGGILDRNFTLDGNMSGTSTSDFCYTSMNASIEDCNFSGYTKDIRFLDIYNIGFGCFDWKINADKDWVKFSKINGTVYSDDRIWVGINWDNVPTGMQTAKITVSEVIGDGVVSEKSFDITVNNDVQALEEKTYAEANGYVSIEAEHYTNLIKNGYYEWSVEEELGRSGDSLKAYPNFGAASVENPTDFNTAVAEYKIYFANTGEFNLDLYRLPTLNERGKQRAAVSMDNSTPVTLTGTNVYQEAKAGQSNWAKQVVIDNETLSTKVKVSEPGYHILKLYAMDTGFIADKIVITTGEKKPSYFGAPESYNTTYNNTAPVFPTQKQVDTTDSKGLFNPDLVTIDTVTEEGRLTGVKFAKAGAAHDVLTVTAAAYGADGAMTAYDTKTVNISSYNLRENFTADEFNLDLTNASSIGIIVYDNADSMQLQAPVKNFKLNNNMAEPKAVFEFKNALSAFEGKATMVTVTDSDGNLVYIGQEYAAIDSYKTIPAKILDKPYYTSTVGIYGQDGVTQRKFYTAANVEADNNGQEYEVYAQSFGSDPVNDSSITVSGNAKYDSDGQFMYLDSNGSGGNVRVTPNGSDGVKMIQGQKIYISSDIYYGSTGTSGRYVNYIITDSKGNEIVNSHLEVYNSSSQSLKIGGKEMITDGKLPSTVGTGSYIRYETEIDPTGGSVTVTITHTGTGKTVRYVGRLQEGVTDVKQLEFSDNYYVNGRNAKIDNILIKRISEEEYGIIIEAKDKNDTTIEDAVTEVTDGVYGTTVTPNSMGKYMLCEGTYNYSVDYNGDVRTGTIDVNRAMDSKDITVRYDIEYENRLDLKVSQEMYDDIYDESILSLDMTGDPSETGLVSYTGGVSYSADNQSIALNGGSAVIELEEPLTSDVKDKVVVEGDIAFSAISGKTSGYTIYDSEGNKIVDFAVEEYNSNPDKYNKFEIGGQTVLSGKSIRECIDLNRNSPLNVNTHFTNTIDFLTGEVSVNIVSGNKNSTFTGTLGVRSDNVKKLEFSSTHTTWLSYMTGAAISLKAVPVKTVKIGVLCDGEPVTDGITELSLTNTQTGKTVDYTDDGILLRAGKYRYKVTYETGGESVTKTGIFTVNEDSIDPIDPVDPVAPTPEPWEEAENELAYLDGDDKFTSYRYNSANAAKTFLVTEASAEKLAALSAGDTVTVTYKLTPTDSAGEPLSDSNQMRYRAGIQLTDKKTFYVNGYTANNWGGWGANDYFANLNVIDNSEPITVTLVYTIGENGKANSVAVSVEDSSGAAVTEPQSSGNPSGDTQIIEGEFDLSSLTVKCGDRGNGKGSTNKCFTLSQLTAVILGNN